MRDTVLIVSDDAEFHAALSRSWQCAGSVPEFELATLDASGNCPLSCVAVVDGTEMLSRLSGEVSLAIVVSNGVPIPEVVGAGRRIVQIQRGTGWESGALALVLQSVSGERAQRQVHEMEKRMSDSKRFSALGRFIAGQQHELANALTSLMGHAELLMTQRDVSDEVRRKVGTVHAMSVRICDVLQQLSSLDRELQKAERQELKKKLDKQVAGAAL